MNNILYNEKNLQLTFATKKKVADLFQYILYYLGGWDTGRIVPYHMAIRTSGLMKKHDIFSRITVSPYPMRRLGAVTCRNNIYD